MNGVREAADKVDTPEVLSEKKSQQWHASTLSVHADDPINSYTDVAPAMHVSTTFRYPHEPENLIPTGTSEVSIALSSVGPVRKWLRIQINSI